MSLVVRNPVFGVSDTNRAAQQQEMARGLKFRIKVVEASYYPYSENKGADQLRSYLRLCFRICKNAGFLMTRLIYNTNHIMRTPAFCIC